MTSGIDDPLPDEERPVDTVQDDRDPGASTPPIDERDEEGLDPLAPARGVIGDPDDVEPHEPA